MDISPLLLSLKTACLATVITFFAGLWIAYKVIKIKHGKAVLDTILTLPMILPPTVVGFFLLLFFKSNASLTSSILLYLASFFSAQHLFKTFKKMEYSFDSADV